MFQTFFLLFSLILLGASVFYRVWEIRIGRFDLKELSKRELALSGAHIEALNNKFLDILRELVHIALVLLVRLAIGILFLIRREAKRLSTKLDHFFLHNGKLETNGSVSVFLKDIADYKKRIKKVRE